MQSYSQSNQLSLKRFFMFGLLVIFMLLLGLISSPTTFNVVSAQSSCVIPPSGPWPPCATGGNTAGGGATTGGNTGGTSAGSCVIPATGPWPECARNGGVTADTNTGGATTGGNSGSSCVIPPSGPWPDCARNGGATADTGGSTGGATTGGTTPPVVAPPPPPTLNRPAAPAGPGAPATSSTVVNITGNVAVAGAQRVGINVGARDQFGAAQILKNLIPNPGFEGGEYAMVIHTLPGGSPSKIQADNWQTNWNNDNLRIGQLPGLWEGGQYEFLTGTSKGRSGTITSFTYDDGRYTFGLSGGGAAPGLENIVLLRKTVGGYEYDTLQTAKAEPNDRRPGSPGQQSLRLKSAGNGFTPAWSTAFDSYARDGDRTAGKLLLVNGAWHFEVWAKPVFGSSTLNVTFRRVGDTPFILEKVNLEPGWQKVSFDVNVPAGADVQIDGVPNPVVIELGVTGSEILVDDIVLQRGDYTNPTVFSDKYVQKLRELRPGTLRNWGDQSGSSLNNQLATQFARKGTTSNPGDRVAKNWHYSLPEFLQLAQTVGSNPWYVVPSTFTKAELENLMAYLGAPAGSHPYANIRAAQGQSAPWTSVFGKIHLEFGNEIWGFNFGSDPFLGSSLRGGVNAGQVANDRIGVMKASPYYNGKFDMVIGGQARFAGRQQEIEDNSSAHDTIGFAPYYGSLERFNTNAERYEPTYAHGSEVALRGPMAANREIFKNSGQGTNMAIYEINVHHTGGAAPIDIRNDVLTGVGGGISLPLTMLSYQRDFGIRTQVGFQALQFSNRLPNGTYARIFGMMRDLEATGLKRPTWLGLELANKAVGGDMLVSNVSGAPSYNQAPFNGIVGNTQTSKIQSFAFKNGNSYSVVLFNLDINNAHQVRIQAPGNPGNGQVWKLWHPDPNMNNEDGWNVDIFSGNMGGSSSLVLPPNSMYVVKWQ